MIPVDTEFDVTRFIPHTQDVIVMHEGRELGIHRWEYVGVGEKDESW